jgi:hypothetical protein
MRPLLMAAHITGGGANSFTGETPVNRSRGGNSFIPCE